MKNVTAESDRHLAEHDDRTGPGADRRGEDIRGVGEDADEFEDADEAEEADEDDDEGTF